jgi:methylthioribose-1-phosphate isomerase
MRVDGKHLRTIWLDADDPSAVRLIDQRQLPHRFIIHSLRSHAEAALAIREMLVRGAPLIGATAAWGVYLAALESRDSKRQLSSIEQAAHELGRTRPTAVNLRWALGRVLGAVRRAADNQARLDAARQEAQAICDEDVEICNSIGRYGLSLIEDIARRKGGEPVNILTHCNAGWLATIDRGTATAPIYLAHESNLPLHVWVDETRPRNQGAYLTAWELAEEGVPHTVVVDNAGGHLMQHGQVDLCITGTDRTTRTGNVANKIGTYLKALAAYDNRVPFYVALPSTSIDWGIDDGIAEIPIEERAPEEISHVRGLDDDGIRTVRILAAGTPVRNYGFDVTPARLITGLITERGICEASEKALASLFGDQAGGAP